LRSLEKKNLAKKNGSRSAEQQVRFTRFEIDETVVLWSGLDDEQILLSKQHQSEKGDAVNWGNRVGEPQCTQQVTKRPDVVKSPSGEKVRRSLAD